MKSYYFMVLLFCSMLSSFAQTNDTIKKDSISLYNRAHQLSKRSNVNKWIYNLVFRASSVATKEVKKEEVPKEKTEKYKFGNGKIIRNIYIETTDPFGYSIDDSDRKPKRKIDKIGNSLHLKTRKRTIRNLLLFKKNDICDSLVLVESERLIRRQRYTRRVVVLPQLIDEANDSIDIVVRTIDSWTLIPTGNISTNQWNAKLTERNLFGIGHQLSGNYKKKINSIDDAMSFNYRINNIQKTYTSLYLNYDNEFNGDSHRSVDLSRPFFSPLTKNAAGVYFENRLLTESFYFNDSLRTNPIKTEFQEFWYGRAFKLNDKATYKNKTRNIIAAFTYNRRHYIQRPEDYLDPYYFFSDSKNFITHIGVSSQKYYQDSYIYYYDIVEDIPYGYSYALTFGYQEKNDLHSYYLGARYSYGKKFEFGYLSGFAEWGTFLNKGNTERLAYKVGLNYFSPLWDIGGWKIRQFIVPYFVTGNNRNESDKDKLTLDGEYGLPKFTSRTIGTKKWLLTVQTQAYIPKTWMGFRFSPYLNCSVGSLVNESKSFFKKETYAKFSVGLLINNDYLVFSRFQISFSYYPRIPFEGDNLFKTNAVDNSEIDLPSFQLSKPRYINYQ